MPDSIDRLQLSELRARFLALKADAAIEIHGWLLGVACAVERQRGADPRDADRLIAELRASKYPCNRMQCQITGIHTVECQAEKTRVDPDA